jgi:hypothetical protein
MVATVMTLGRSRKRAIFDRLDQVIAVERHIAFLLFLFSAFLRDRHLGPK